MSTTVSYWPVVIRWGVIGSLILIIYTTLSIMLGLSNPSNFLNIFLGFIISVAISVFISRQAILTQKTALGGYISLGQAFMVAFLVLLIAGLVNTLYSYIYMTVIDPDLMNRIMESTMQLYEQMGLTEEQIEEAMAQGASQMGAVSSLIGGLIGAPISSAIFAIIMAAILKKDPPVESTVLDSEG